MPLSGSPTSELPFDLLHHIFLAVQTLAFEERGEYSHGGALVGWDSNEDLHPFALVCRGWQEAANAVLYQSVALRGGAVASRFLSTVRTRPDLAARVHWLAIGLTEEEEEGGGDMGEGDERRAAASVALVDALLALPHVDHLLLRTLDLSVRPSLLTFFARPRRLASLVLIARDGPQWGTLLYYIDAPLVFPDLKRLDVDVNTSVGAAPLPLSIVFPAFEVPALTHFCYNADYPLQFTYPCITSSLTSLYLYFEHLRPVEEAAEVLSRATNLRHLRYTCNPSYEQLENDYASHRLANPTPTLDLVLPSLLHLETLAVSSTDISSSFLALIPSRLRHIRIQAYSSHGFQHPRRMLQMLRDSSLDLKSLREIEMEDSSERWSEQLRWEMGEACAMRGIHFHFVPDDGSSEEEDEEMG